MTGSFIPANRMGVFGGAADCGFRSLRRFRMENSKKSAHPGRLAGMCRFCAEVATGSIVTADEFLID